MKLVNKWNMGLHRFAAKKTSRYSTKSVYVDKNQTVATDGKQLLYVTLPDDKPEDFPQLPELDTMNGDKPFMLPSDDAKAIEKRIPKSKLKPILETAAVSSDGIKAKVVTTDLEVTTATEHRAIEGKFPDYGKVFPEGDACLTIDFDGKRLGDLLEYMAKFTNDDNGRVTLEFYAEDQAVKLTTKNTDTGQQATGLVMPLEK